MFTLLYSSVSSTATCGTAPSFFVITRDPGDRETVSFLKNFVEEVGVENVFIDSVLYGEIEEDDIRIPQPQLNTSSNEALRVNVSILSLYLYMVISLFSLK